MQIHLIRIEWPEISIYHIIFTSLIIIILIIIFFLLRRYYNIKLQNEKKWFNLLSYLYRKDLTPKQISLLKAFFFNMPSLDNSRLLTDRDYFYDQLFNYLEHENDFPVESKMQLLDLLFSDRGIVVNDIISTNDIYEGEPCSVEINDEYYLGKIIQVKVKHVLIFIPKISDMFIVKDKKAKVFIYRYNAGGFLLFGDVYQAVAEYIYFIHNGKIERNYYNHVMIDIELIFELRIWPVKRISIEKPTRIKSVTKQITERALSFTFYNNSDLEIYEKYSDEIWQIILSLEEEYDFICRGRIIKSKDESTKLFYFKYIDIPERDNENLFNFLKNHQPRREILNIVK